MANNTKEDTRFSENHGDGTALGYEEKNPCEGCYHWRGEHGWSKCCNYIFDMHRRRPCEPGEHCRVKRPSSREERQFKK